MDAARYYERESPAAKTRFLNEFEACKRQIIQFPESSARIYGEVRRKQLSSYPYALVYRIDLDGDIRVIAVTHLKRKPFYWLGRE